MSYPPANFRSVFGVTPLTSGPAGGSNPVQDFMSTVYPRLKFDKQSELNADLARQIKLMQVQSDIQKAANQNPGGVPNTVLAQGQINPLQAAQLALKQAAEQGKNTRAEESIAGRESIASQAESGRSNRANLRSQTQLQMSDDRIKQSMKSLGLKEDQFDYYKQLHNVPDDQRLKMVQDGKISLEDLKNVHAMEQIGQRGDQSIQQIQERGNQQRQTQGNKSQTPQQQAAGYENTARQLRSSNPDYSDYIKFNPDTNKFMGVVMPSNGDINIYHSINSQIYGKDVNLPSDSGKPQSMNDNIYRGGGNVTAPEDDNSPKQVTQYQQGDDPLGLFGGGNDSGDAS